MADWPGSGGSKVHPSSELRSHLPTPLTGIQLTGVVVVSSRANCVPPIRPSMKVPSGRTTLGASPMFCQPGGGFTGVQVPPGPSVGLKIEPLFVRDLWGVEVYSYSPPSTMTRPSGRTADAKSLGAYGTLLLSASNATDEESGDQLRHRDMVYATDEESGDHVPVS